MQSSKVFAFGIVVVLLYFTAYCSAIQCFNCNSHYDESCGDPFDQDLNSTVGAPLVNCDALGKDDGHNYTYCRKTVQTVGYGTAERRTTRILRGCGYKGDTRMEPEEGDEPSDLRCYRRTGTFDVEIHFCGCHTDGCNSAGLPGLSNVLMLALVFFGAAVCQL